MKIIVKRVLKSFAAVLSAAAALFVFVFFRSGKKIKQKIDSAKIKAQEERDRVYEEIKNTDSSSLVDSACNADELHAICEDIKQDAAEAIQHRINEAGL